MAVVEFGCTGEPRRWGLILFGMGPSSPMDGQLCDSESCRGLHMHRKEQKTVL